MVLHIEQIKVAALQGSGIAGSWWALKEITNDRCDLLSHTERKVSALKFLLANTKPQRKLGWHFLNSVMGQSWPLPTQSFAVRTFCDLMDRPVGLLPHGVAVYTSGFPCQPFSLLHNGTALMDEPQAEVFKEVVKTMYRVRPLIAILENVMGLNRCWSIVEQFLQRLPNYRFCKLVIDPIHLGDPVTRRRIYIILIQGTLDS